MCPFLTCCDVKGYPYATERSHTWLEMAYLESFPQIMEKFAPMRPQNQGNSECLDLAGIKTSCYYVLGRIFSVR